MSRALRVYTRVRELHVKGVSLITSATADHLLLRGQMAAETAKIGLTPLSCEHKNYSAIRNAISHPFSQRALREDAGKITRRLAAPAFSPQTSSADYRSQLRRRRGWPSRHRFRMHRKVRNRWTTRRCSRGHRPSR